MTDAGEQFLRESEARQCRWRESIADALGITVDELAQLATTSETVAPPPVPEPSTLDLDRVRYRLTHRPVGRPFGSKNTRTP